jgi:hypothetical protein
LANQRSGPARSPQDYAETIVGLYLQSCAGLVGMTDDKAADGGVVIPIWSLRRYTNGMLTICHMPSGRHQGAICQTFLTGQMPLLRK